MSHFNQIINSMLRGCIEIDSQFLFFIFSRDGSNSEPPIETFSNFVENSVCIHKYQRPGLFCFIFGGILFVYWFVFLFIRWKSPATLTLLWMEISFEKLHGEKRLPQPEQHQNRLCLFYKRIYDTRQNNKPKTSEDLKYLSLDYQSTEIKCKILHFKSS